MDNLKIEDLPRLEQLSDDELNQVVGGMACPRNSGNNVTAQGTTGSLIDTGGLDLDILDDVIVIGGN